MGRIRPIVALATLLAVVPVLSACSSFDPDKLDIFGLSEEKKLEGDRKPLFPNGVPGVPQGVPPELIKGSQAQQQQQQQQAPPPPADGTQASTGAAPAQPQPDSTARQ